MNNKRGVEDDCLPDGFMRIGDYIAELEAEPEYAARLIEARRNLKTRLAALFWEQRNG